MNYAMYANMDTALNAFVLLCLGAAVAMLIGYAITEWRSRK